MNIGSLCGFAFDLDGTLWAGPNLLPGAIELLAALRESGCRVVALTNSSRLLSTHLSDKLQKLGIPLEPVDVLSALDLLGDTIRQHLGPARVLPLGSAEMIQGLQAAGHTIVAIEDWVEAEAVAVGNDPAFDFARLRAASRAVATGASFFTVNLDPRLPVGAGEFDPGCGALTEAIAVASGVRPLVIGKPHPTIFEKALDRLGCQPSQAAMVGDSLSTDIAGGQAAGMFTVWLNPESSQLASGKANLTVRNLVELHDIWRKDHAASAATARF